jgi:hypothetical protein
MTAGSKSRIRAVECKMGRETKTLTAILSHCISPGLSIPNPTGYAIVLRRTTVVLSKKTNVVACLGLSELT